PADRAGAAAAAMRPRPALTVELAHLHAAKVPVPEEADRMGELLAAGGIGASLGFPDLVAECASGLQIVARFLGLLELYRRRSVAVEQPEPLGELAVTWLGARDDGGAAAPIREEGDGCGGETARWGRAR